MLTIKSGFSLISIIPLRSLRPSIFFPLLILLLWRQCCQAEKERGNDLGSVTLHVAMPNRELHYTPEPQVENEAISSRSSRRLSPLRNMQARTTPADGVVKRGNRNESQREIRVNEQHIFSQIEGRGAGDASPVQVAMKQLRFVNRQLEYSIGQVLSLQAKQQELFAALEELLLLQQEDVMYSCPICSGEDSHGSELTTVNDRDFTGSASKPTSSTSFNGIDVRNREAAGGSSSSRFGLSIFEKDILDTHNLFRLRSGLGGVDWSFELAKFMGDYLKSQDRNDNCTMRHSSPDDRRQVGEFQNVGENLYMIYGTLQPPGGRQVAESWYNELYCYRYGPVGHNCTKFFSPVCGQRTGFEPSQPPLVGHFTQLMWYSATHLGCAVVECGRFAGWGRKYLVGCSYGSNQTEYGGNLVGDHPFERRIAEALGIDGCNL